MKVAVITPYYTENTDILRRCHESVLNQTYSDVTHIMIADGHPHPWCHSQKLDHFVLPTSHNDAGATPRALGAISAFSRGYNAVAFLDADNWFEPSHIQCMVETMQTTNADVVSATRIIVLENGYRYIDGFESIGKEFTDTNCMFLSRKCLHHMTRWVADPGKTLWSDRSFWDSLVSSGYTIARCSQPTVAYVTKWATHYLSVNLEPPPESVWIDYDEQGNLRHKKHKDVRK